MHNRTNIGNLDFLVQKPRDFCAPYDAFSPKNPEELGGVTGFSLGRKERESERTFSWQRQHGYLSGIFSARSLVFGLLAINLFYQRLYWDEAFLQMEKNNKNSQVALESKRRNSKKTFKETKQ